METTTTDSDLRRARAVARVLDSAVGIPGTPIRVGLDAVLGLIPGGGDVASAALGGYIVMAAVRRGAPKAVLARMVFNVLLDTVVGSVPVLGDLFDVVYRSNQRNVALLERYAEQPGVVRRQSRWIAAAVIAALALIAVGVGVLAFLSVRAAWRLLTA